MRKLSEFEQYPKLGENPVTETNEPVVDAKADAKSRGLRTLGQAVVSGALTFLGALGAEMAVPGFEFSPEAVGIGMAIATLTPILAWLQRRAGK